MPKKLWIELGDVVVGDVVFIYRELVTVTRVSRTKGKVNLTGKEETGEQVIFIGYPDESVQRVEDEQEL